MKSKSRIDVAQLEKAIDLFLTATGVDRRDPNFSKTPKLVAEAWQKVFLKGYLESPQDILSEFFPLANKMKGAAVVVTHIPFFSMCPHHLVPYKGVAHVAYLPLKKAIGLGRIPALVECFSRRLILQEDLAHDIARNLYECSRADGAACILSAEHMCMQARGNNLAHTEAHSEAFYGAYASTPSLRRELWLRIEGAGHESR